MCKLYYTDTLIEHYNATLIEYWSIYRARFARVSTNSPLTYQYEMVNSQLAITNVISNKCEWNNCFSKFGTVV